MLWMMGFWGCTDRVGSDSGDGASLDYCEEISFEFGGGPEDQPPTCVKELTEVIGSLNPDVDFSNESSAKYTLDPQQMAYATLSALHGQVNGELQSAYGKTSAQTYEVVCDRLVTALNKLPPPHGEEPEEVCNTAEEWAQDLALDAYYTCGPVYLSTAMTTVLNNIAMVNPSEGFWARVKTDPGTNPNLIWLPMYLAMYHGGSPSVLFYSTAGGTEFGDLAILELGMEVYGPEQRVQDFWAFIDGAFDELAYSPSSADPWTDLTIILPSRITWRDGQSIDTWEYGQAVQGPFLEPFTTTTGLVDPCLGDRISSEGTAVGGASGGCDNTFERMMAVTNQLKDHPTAGKGLIDGGTAEPTCVRTAHDFTLD